MESSGFILHALSPFLKWIRSEMSSSMHLRVCLLSNLNIFIHANMRVKRTCRWAHLSGLIMRPEQVTDEVRHPQHTHTHTQIHTMGRYEVLHTLSLAIMQSDLMRDSLSSWLTGLLTGGEGSDEATSRAEEQRRKSPPLTHAYKPLISGHD